MRDRPQKSDGLLCAPVYSLVKWRWYLCYRIMDGYHTRKVLETIDGNRKPSMDAGGFLFTIPTFMCLLAAMSWASGL